MKLLVDIGNSAIKTAVLQQGEMSDYRSMRYQSPVSNDVIEQLWGKQEKPAEVWVANVGGHQIEKVLTNWIEAHWQCRVYFAKTEKHTAGVSNGYDDIQQLGVDRWLAMVAAKKLVGCPVIIVDCGTAVTIDAIHSNGEHLGGFILCGLQTQINALLKSTVISVKWTSANVVFEPAKNTESAIIRATVYSIVTWIERVVEDLANLHKIKFNRVITGGEAAKLIPYLNDEWFLKDDLVLSGLKYFIENP